MKGRLFLVFTLTIGLALLLTWAVAAQEAEVTADVQSTSSVVSTDHTEYYSNHQGVASLGYTSDITFTPAFTTYLPAVFKGYGACSTIPTLISPNNGSSLNTLIPLFGWDSGNDPNATQGHLQVARDPEFTQWANWLSYSPARGIWEFRFARNFDSATTYYWRAWLMCGDTQGPYSEVWSFTTGSGGTTLPAPTLITPTNGGTVPSLQVTLQWSAVDGAVEYLVRWRRVGEGGYSYNWIDDTQATLWLSANTTYEWWVSARNDYAIGADSEKWQFTTPVGSSSVSPQDLNRSFVIEGGSATIVFEGQDSK